jgi:NADH-quinone oxidoreductase subunit E
VKVTEQERHELEALLSEYPVRRAGGVTVLKYLQQRRGWISDETLREAADLIGVSPTELEGVATFYNLLFRRPVGRHVILVCDSITCWIMGGERIIDHLQQRLGTKVGETTDDDEFTLLPICCIGNCDHAPTMIIDGQYYDDLTPERVDEILDGIRNAPGEGGDA